jgi:sulfatase modifying factor 1
LISAPVQLASSGREQFPVGMERSGCLFEGAFIRSFWESISQFWGNGFAVLGRAFLGVGLIPPVSCVKCVLPLDRVSRHGICIWVLAVWLSFFIRTRKVALMKRPTVLFARLPRVVFMVGVAALLGSLAVPAHAAPVIDWVTVGDPGNTADTSGNPNPAGDVADSFQIMKYEFTNQQYTDFLNSVDPSGTNPNSVYNTNQGSNARGGISFISGNASGSKYAIRTNMGDKPVNYVSWFDAARVSNWLMNGATGTSSTETGAYTLSGTSTAPAVNSGATFYIPTEDQWYKAAYYKGGSTNAGYWDYATQSDTAPTPVTSGSTGIGSAGSAGSFANYNDDADWNSQNGNVTTVGSNGGPSAYGAFDMSGNVREWNDLDGNAGSFRGRRGAGWGNDAFDLSSSSRFTVDPSLEHGSLGFRLASPVPEPATLGLASGGALCACGWWVLKRRRRA